MTNVSVTVSVTVLNRDLHYITSAAYCYVNNTSASIADYGLLYNWFAAFDSRGICPNGFKTVVMYSYRSLGGGSSGGTGGLLKETGYTYWKSPNTDATNSSGFSAGGAGYRDADGNYQMFNEINYFWDVEQFSGSSDAYVARLEYNTGDFLTDFSTLDKNYGLSIRCLKK